MSTATTVSPTKAYLGEWTHPRTGEHRRYVNNLRQIIGLDLDYHRTGNVRNATLGGDPISNAMGTHLAAVKVWLDDSDEIHVERHTDARYITADDIRALVRAAL